MSEDLLHRMALAAKEFGESLWIKDPSAVVQLSVWTERGVDDVVVGYTGDKITARIGHEEMDTRDTFQRLRSEIDGDDESDSG